MLPSLKELSDTLLLENVKAFKHVEDQTIADLVLYISEIYELLRDGKLSLCAVAEISKVIRPENKAELLELSQGKAKIEIQKIILKYQPSVKTFVKEKIVARRVVVANKDPLFSAAGSNEDSVQAETIETSYAFTVAADEEFMELLREAKNLIGVVPSVEVLKRTLKEFVSRRKAAPRNANSKKVDTILPVVNKSANKVPKIEAVSTIEARPITKTQSRYISRAVAHRVKVRN